MYNYKDKGGNIKLLEKYTLAKTLSMFDYEGLPETIPERELERILQETGQAFIYKWGNEIYAFRCSVSGETDIYGNPKELSITNNETHEVKIVKVNEGVLINSDDYNLGILKLISKYSYLIIENEITLVMTGYNNRVQKIISAIDDTTKESADKFMSKLIGGELSVIGESPFLEDLKVQGSNMGESSKLSNLIEYDQYLKASLLNELGIQANTVNKKERLIRAELEQNKEHLFPLINNMYDNRILGVQALNEMYGLNVTVKYGSIWKERNIEKGDNDNDIEAVENPVGNGRTDNPDENSGLES